MKIRWTIPTMPRLTRYSLMIELTQKWKPRLLLSGTNFSPAVRDRVLLAICAVAMFMLQGFLTLKGLASWKDWRCLLRSQSLIASCNTQGTDHIRVSMVARGTLRFVSVQFWTKHNYNTCKLWKGRVYVNLRWRSKLLFVWVVSFLSGAFSCLFKSVF